MPSLGSTPLTSTSEGSALLRTPGEVDLTYTPTTRKSGRSWQQGRGDFSSPENATHEIGYLGILGGGEIIEQLDDTKEDFGI